MQRHRRLAGSRTALDHEDAGQGRADDLVLLALDGADDVAHVACPGLAQGGEERTGATEDQPVGEQAFTAVARRPTRVGRRHGMPVGVHEVLVLQPEHGPATHRQMPAPRQPLGIETGRPVERLGDRGAPVDHQRLVVRARNGEAADVERLAERRAAGAVRRLGARFGEAVDTAEVEGLVADVELFQPGQAGADHDVALGARLERAAAAEVEHALQHLARLAPHELQPVVGAVEEFLLVLQIRMSGHRSPFSPRPRGNGPV